MQEGCEMIKAIGLYLLSLLLLSISAWQPSIGWLAPVGLALLFFGSVLLWRIEGYRFINLGFKKVPNWSRYLGGGILIGMAFPLIITLLIWIAGWAEISIETQPGSVILSGIIIALLRSGLIAFVEEVIFRGYFYRIMGFQYGIRIAILVSSILWAITHLPDMMASGMSFLSILIGMLTFTIWGIFLAATIHPTGDSLWMPFGVHFGTNFIFSILGFFIASKLTGPEVITGHPAWIPESGLLGMLGWGAVLLILLGIIRGRGEKEQQLTS
jgi:membrane protease YdiL (CAAX protease family)